MSHPYGIKPLANLAFFESSSDSNYSVVNIRSKGLGRLSILKDEIIIEILAYLNAIELSQTEISSRCLYSFSMTSDLWRDLFLRFYKSSSLKFINSWRDTFVIEYCKNRNSYKVNGCLSEKSVVHKPIKIERMFSDFLYRLWACHSFDLPLLCPGILKHDESISIPRIDFNSISYDYFIENYEQLNKPVVIVNATKDWSALNKWTDEYLIQKCKDTKFRATSATAPEAASFTMEEYFNYMSQTQEEVPLYLFERGFVSKVTSFSDDYKVPNFFSSEVHPETDLFRVLGKDERPDYRWLVAGPKRSGSIFHIDPNQTNAWNVSIRGRKKWIFYPPGVCPPGVKASQDGADVLVPLSTGEWLLSFWSYHLEQREASDYKVRPLEVIAHEGECVFVPHNWWHCVINLDDCIAITQNYVSQSNLVDCLRFLRTKTDQISGINDRKNEALPAEKLYETFVTKLQDSHIFTDEELTQYVCSSHLPLPCLDSHSEITKRRKNCMLINRYKKNMKKQKMSSALDNSTLNAEMSDNISQTKVMNSEMLFSFNFYSASM